MHRIKHPNFNLNGGNKINQVKDHHSLKFGEPSGHDVRYLEGRALMKIFSQ